MDNSQPPEDEEAAITAVDEDEDGLATPRPGDVGHDVTICNLEWDDLSATPGPSLSSSGGDEPLNPPRAANPRDKVVPYVTSKPKNANERTPLLRKAVSMSSDRPRRTSPTRVGDKSSAEEVNESMTPTLARRASTSSALGVKRNIGGRSTFGQTLFNAIAILLGIGVLSEPLAFAYAGWICGTLLIIFYGFVTCYTAKILARIVLADPRFRSYSDIGRRAFGPRSTPFISAMFCFELFSVSVVLVTLYADSLHVVIPAFSSNAYKIAGIVIFIPTVFLPLSLLSYTSVLGIVSTIFLIVVIFIDGFSIRNGPGSLWSPAETNLGIEGLEKLGVAFGLFMAGFSGHAVIPSLARDMIDPSAFDTAMNYAFTFATLVYAAIGVAGYLMFGNDVSDEVSQNLLGIPGYNPALNQIALWMLVISPLTKFALSARPLNVTIEIILGLDNGSSLPSEDKPTASGQSTHASNLTLKRILIAVERVLFVLFAVGVSILVPEFSSMMAILGSFSAFILCVIGPVSAKVALERRCSIWDAFLLVTAVVMAVWGTGAAFWSTTL